MSKFQYTEEQHLRSVRLDGGFTLTVWDTDRYTRQGKSILGYRLWEEGSHEGSHVIFEGEDFGCSPMHAVDSDETLRAIIGFLTLTHESVGEDWFEEYTPEQLLFVDEAAEDLSIYTEADLSPPFEDLC